MSSASGCADAHVGKGVSIGTVFASERYIAPMAVGVDIGIPLVSHTKMTCLLPRCLDRGMPAQSKIAKLCMCQYVEMPVYAGCGMCAVPFNDLHKDDLRLRDLKKIQRLIKERIPTGSATGLLLGACLSSVYILSDGSQQQSKRLVALTAKADL